MCESFKAKYCKRVPTMPEYHYVAEDIFAVSEFFTPEECAAAIERAEAAGFYAAPINTRYGAQVREDIRNNSRVIIDDPQLAAHLWERTRDYVPINTGGWTAVGINERFRYYRYEVGEQFEWHRDGAFERANGERSRLTFMIYLNEDFEGGRTTFDTCEIIPQTGLALFFLHPLLHKGQPVTQGCKYAIRTDVMYRPNAE